MSFREKSKQETAAMIGKTRQEIAQIEESFDPAVGPPRGVLQQPQSKAGRFRHGRAGAHPDLVAWVDHYWMVFWDLRGLEPRLVETLPHPNVHIVFELGSARAWGISTSKFSRYLEGKDHVFGIKFTPGGFHPFLQKSVYSLANCSVPLCEIFGDDAEAVERTILSTEDQDVMVNAANAFLLARKPAPDAKADLARELVGRILREPEILTVEDLAERSAMSLRSLQRLFSQYVGVSPKWVIRRYRLHELVERMHSGERLDWAQLAVELGYFDQAHLIHDFKAISGCTPTEYAKQSHSSQNRA
jgi:AraC-like DNA-binding protein